MGVFIRCNESLWGVRNRSIIFIEAFEWVVFSLAERITVSFACYRMPPMKRLNNRREGWICHKKKFSISIEFSSVSAFSFYLFSIDSSRQKSLLEIILSMVWNNFSAIVLSLPPWCNHFFAIFSSANSFAFFLLSTFTVLIRCRI